jgi:peptide/nickel transport system substrate-binding protein
MKEAYAPFLLDVGTGPVLPRHLLAGTQNIRRDQFNRNPVGCGPFKLSDWQSGSSIRLEANGTYWRRRPNLDHFLFKIVPDATTQIDQLQTGEIDIVNVAQLALWEHVKGLAPAVATALYDDFRYAFVQLDEYGSLKDVAVRQALDYATPKKAIIQGVLRNLAVPALTDVPPRSPYYNPNVERHDYDEVKASAVLARAGFTMQNGILTKAGQPLEVPIYTVASSPAYVQLAQVLKDSWSRIGVKTSVTTMEASTLFSKQGPQWNGKDAALIYSISPGADPYNYVNWSSQQIPNTEDDPGQNYGRYVNPVVDKLVVKGAQVVDIGQRKKVYDELQQILAHDVPAIFMYFPKALFAYNSKLRGFQPDPFSGLFAGVWDWTKA